MAALTDRDPLTPILQRQARDIRRLYQTLGDALETAIAARTRIGGGDRPVTEADRAAIMQAVRQGLNAIWGPYSGSESAMRAVVLRDTTAARFLPLDTAVKDYRAAMSRTLRERVEAEAQR